MELPKDIPNLVNLRHLVCTGGFRILLLVINKPMNLQTISDVKFKDIVGSWVKLFPCVKKLSCYIFKQQECNLQSFTSLERLKLLGSWHIRRKIKFIGFPPLLKSLTLEDFYLPWNVMSIIQTLPNLEVLKLIRADFDGPKWDVGEQQFRQLKFSKLHRLNIKEWEASSINFPCLQHLVVEWCYKLEEIPPDFGNIPTLELINISYCKESVAESLEIIKEEQHAQGNSELKINVINEY